MAGRVYNAISGGGKPAGVTAGSYLVGAGVGQMTEKTPDEVRTHIGAAAAGHTHTAAQVGALPTAGGTLTGQLTAGGAQDAGTAQVRNIVISTAEPLGVGNGTIWLQYEEAGA